MLRRASLVFGLLILTAGTAAAQRRSEFCRGFEEGYKTISGGIVPICPVAPVTPVGSTPFREGVKAGESAAQRSGNRTPMASQRENAGTFCQGFSEGYKAIKGKLIIVPICPVAPVTPVGSTAYREGLKAGMAEARKP